MSSAQARLRTVARLSRRKSKPSSLLVTYVTSLLYAARLSASYAAAGDMIFKVKHAV